jgi:hypothetical protein
MSRLLRFLKNLFWKSSNTSYYVIEYRYCGYPHKYFRSIYNYFQRRFRMTHPNYHYVPHITLLAPIESNNEKLLIELMKPVLSKYHHKIHEIGNLVESGDLIKFNTKEKQVLAVDIVKRDILEDIRTELENTFKKQEGISFTGYKERLWHTTIWNDKTGKSKIKFKKVWQSAKQYRIKELNFIIDRITLIKNGKILKEFDLVNDKVLSRKASLNGNARYNSYLSIRALLKEKGEIPYQKTRSNIVSEEDMDWKDMDGTIQSEWDN